jgi:benzodiazapine receptor
MSHDTLRMTNPLRGRSALHQTAVLAGFLAICLAAGALGGLATSSKIPTWYASLYKPSWNPPSWLFAPVWTTLYILMGVSGWLVWRKSLSLHAQALSWFWVQLALNTVWSLVFFGLEQPGLAFAEIVLLWLAIIATVVSFRQRSGTAAVLLVPYLGWVSFAAFLNFTIWRLNQ